MSKCCATNSPDSGYIYRALTMFSANCFDFEKWWSMDDEQIEDLIRDLVLQRRNAETSGGAELGDWRVTLSAVEDAVDGARDAVMQATVRDIGHLETAWGALKGIHGALARFEAAEAAERNWSECAEVALARLQRADKAIECLEAALRCRLPAFSPNPKREYVISLLLDGLDRAVRAFERGKSGGLRVDKRPIEASAASSAGILAEAGEQSLGEPFPRAA
jgi:hypothetical protein